MVTDGGMSRLIFFFVGFNCLAFICCAQDTITLNDVKVIKSKSEITIERYLNNLQYNFLCRR